MLIEETYIWKCIYGRLEKHEWSEFHKRKTQIER